MMVLEHSVAKISKTADENGFFGLKDTCREIRSDYAVAQTETQVIAFNTEEYRAIIAMKEFTTAEKKVEFLMRFGPKLRDFGRNMVEEYEVMWLKQEATKGYQIQKFGEQGDVIYMLCSGEVRMTVPIGDSENEGKVKQLVFGYLKVGDIFGEQSALEDYPNPWSIEVTSKTASFYQIHRSNFIKYFGGNNGPCARYLRSQIQMKRNWD